MVFIPFFALFVGLFIVQMPQNLEQTLYHFTVNSTLTLMRFRWIFCFFTTTMLYIRQIISTHILFSISFGHLDDCALRIDLAQLMLLCLFFFRFDFGHFLCLLCGREVFGTLSSYFFVLVYQQCVILFSFVRAMSCPVRAMPSFFLLF